MRSRTLRRQARIVDRRGRDTTKDVLVLSSNVLTTDLWDRPRLVLFLLALCPPSLPTHTSRSLYIIPCLAKSASSFSPPRQVSASRTLTLWSTRSRQFPRLRSRPSPTESMYAPYAIIPHTPTNRPHRLKAGQRPSSSTRASHTAASQIRSARPTNPPSRPPPPKSKPLPNPRRISASPLP